MHNKSDNALGSEKIVRLCLPAAVDNCDLAALLSPLLENHQQRVCLDMGRVSRLGIVEFRVLGAFDKSFKARGGFLKLENVNGPLAVLVREFGRTDLMSVAPEQPALQKASHPAGG